MKIINDPVHGFIDIPTGLIMDVIAHPWFQRLRRIRQGGFSNLVYPGAVHTRFHHALGAYHLATKTIEVLRRKGIPISKEEEEGLQLALLLHDIGHGPYSHSMEGQIINVSHEEITLAYMKALNVEFQGKLSLAIEMFCGAYARNFFNQLISSQLDLDRLDYLSRDSFFTGVSEGVIGYSRIIHMMNVSEDTLVIEEKGLYSIEKFILSRKLMYAQVYQHKVVVAAEAMLKMLIDRLKVLPAIENESKLMSLIRTNGGNNTIESINLSEFSKLDDCDVIQMLKELQDSSDFELNLLANGLINRDIFKIFTSYEKKDCDLFQINRLKLVGKENKITVKGQVSQQLYLAEKEEIFILLKSGKILQYSEFRGDLTYKHQIKYYICYPKS